MTHKIDKKLKAFFVYLLATPGGRGMTHKIEKKLKDVPAISATELVRCQHCNSMLHPKNVEKHLRKVHRITYKPSIPLSPKKVESKEEICPVRKIHRIDKPSSPKKVELKTETCPVCNGDGGVRGGCYKCDGSGWVSASSRLSYRGNAVLPGNKDNSRVSNANYFDSNLGAHYRDRDGRFGSNPEHDDFSDEGNS
jgi:hypothetical protein